MFRLIDCKNALLCGEGEDLIISDTHGGKDKNGNYHDCTFELWCDDPFGCGGEAEIGFCCNPTSISKETINLPVPLEDLFPTNIPIPDDDTQKMDIKIDRTMGGQRTAGNDADPNNNAFGFYIMSGPENEITTFNKRDSSHWELFGCDAAVGEARQTVKAVCTDITNNSNCEKVFQGGVATTVIEMPDDCGPGKYAIAVDLIRSTNHSHLHPHLAKRGLQDHPIYDFTFDYDFSPLQKRGQSNVRVRIDYSDDPGYWKSIVAGHHNKEKRDAEVERDFDGNHKAWVEYTWHKEKWEADKEALHKRWWSGDVREWWDAHRKVDVEYTGIRHRVMDTFPVKIFEEDLNCPQFDWVDELYFRAWAELTVDIETAAGVTVIVSSETRLRTLRQHPSDVIYRAILET